MRTHNPLLNEGRLAGALADGAVDRMTITGAVHKTGILTVIAVATACLPWWLYFHSAQPGGFGNPAAAMPLAIVGAIGGLVIVLVLAFKPAWSPVLAPVYAALEGLLLGGVSAFYQAQWKGIVVQAAALTLGVLVVMLLVYGSRVIRVTNKLRIGIMAATGAVMLVYLVGIVMSFFGRRIPMIHDAGIVGIGFSLLVVGIAAFNLLLDFDFVERGAKAGYPKYLEWYAGVGLLVTLVWIYLEVLRLLSKLNRR